MWCRGGNGCGDRIVKRGGIKEGGNRDRGKNCIQVIMCIKGTCITCIMYRDSIYYEDL